MFDALKKATPVLAKPLGWIVAALILLFFWHLWIEIGQKADGLFK